MSMNSGDAIGIGPADYAVWWLAPHELRARFHGPQGPNRLASACLARPVGRLAHGVLVAGTR